MARRTQRVLNQGQYVKATDLWYLTEIVLIQETHDIDFYNVLYNIDFAQPEAAKSTREFLSPRDVAYQVLVNYRSSYPALIAALDDEEPPELSLTDMMRTVVHPKLQLPENVTFGSQSGIVFDTLAGDFMKPVVEMVEKVLNETSVKVNVYSGQLDLICSTPGTISWVNRMNWGGKKQYASSPRDGIGVNGILEGYVRKYGNFGMYWVSYLFVHSQSYFYLNFINRSALTFS
jgi:serine carboxypeptidase 1